MEVNEVGINRRFVVTNRADLSPRPLYDHYSDRGQTENYIKAFKIHLKMGRLSCHRFWANQFRLLLALAYQMFLILRDYLYATPWQNLEVELRSGPGAKSIDRCWPVRERHTHVSARLGELQP